MGHGPEHPTWHSKCGSAVASTVYGMGIVDSLACMSVHASWEGDDSISGH